MSTLARTEPRLIGYFDDLVFDDLAFDEVLRHGDLALRARLMVQLASLIARQGLGEYRGRLGGVRAAGAP